MLPEQCVTLKLPPDVRNIPIRPMHTTSALTACVSDTLFVAGVRKHFYIFNASTGALVQTIEAHFGRILCLRSFNAGAQNVLVSSSIDRSIKIWNLENIFRKHLCKSCTIIGVCVSFAQ